MFKKIYYLTLSSFVLISSFLTAEIKYDIQDIGTLQTRSSQAIALNNQGQILGSYNIDGSKDGKHFFVRDKDGSFHEITEDYAMVYENIPQQLLSTRIDWRYLTDDGKAYGTFTLPNTNPVLFMWDRHQGTVKLGILPGKEIMAINNAGQVLIKSVVVYENGKPVRSPVIWQNGHINNLEGLGGDLGIESEESYGFDMNNYGNVVGQSVVYLSYKNNLYKQVHATMWVDGQAIDLHHKVTKRSESAATVINDLNEILIEGLFLHADGNLVNIGRGVNGKATDKNYLYFKDFGVFDKFGAEILSPGRISGMIGNDSNSIWIDCEEIICVNDNGEAIAQGETIYGEKHIMFLTPIKP